MTTNGRQLGKTVIDGARRLFVRVLIKVWRRLEPIDKLPRTYGPAASDSLQQTMNLVMPLKHPGPETTAKVFGLVAAHLDEIHAGLDNVGTVHFARFDVIDGRLCMFSVYDGDFATYIRDFIVVIGDVFEAILDHLADPPELRPVHRYADAFVQWVVDHDLMQLPEDPTTFDTERIEDIPRRLMLLLDKEPDVQLGSYSAYPGFSVAQVRDRLGVGW